MYGCATVLFSEHSAWIRVFEFDINVANKHYQFADYFMSDAPFTLRD